MAKKKKAEEDLVETDLYPDEEQGMVAKETHDELLDDIKKGQHEVDPLSSEGRESLVEDDEIEPWEAGFSEGASDEGQLGKDALTGEPLMDEDEVVETEVSGKLYRFVNEQNAQKFRLKQKNGKAR